MSDSLLVVAFVVYRRLSDCMGESASLTLWPWPNADKFVTNHPSILPLLSATSPCLPHWEQVAVGGRNFFERFSLGAWVSDVFRHLSIHTHTPTRSALFGVHSGSANRPGIKYDIAKTHWHSTTCSAARTRLACDISRLPEMVLVLIFRTRCNSRRHHHRPSFV